MVLLLIRGDLRRCQAEIPLIPLFRFAEPAFRSWVAVRLSRHWLRSTPISRVQRGRPSGGLEQAVATSRASSLPESLRLAPGRGSSLSAASRLLTTKRRLVRYTVEPPTPTLIAISLSLAPASAASKICARLNLRAACLPPLRSAVSAPRSAWLRSIRYRTFICASSEFEA